MNTKSSILVLTAHYLPQTRSNGPAKSVDGIIQRLYHDFDFRVLTADRDIGDLQPPPDVQVGSWQSVKNGQVYHLPRKKLISPLQLRKYLQTFAYDLVYLNSYFDTLTVVYLLLRRFGWLVKKPLIIAPRGEFGGGALALKSVKKRTYMWLANMLGLYSHALWHASSEYEMQEIKRIYPNAKIHIAPNMSSLVENNGEVLQPSKPSKIVGQIRLVYLSRIAPIKQLNMALEMLARVSGVVEFAIYGPISDEEYWEKCKVLIAQLPPNIRVTYYGEVEHENVWSTLQDHHVFFLPTASENYGHAIVEAFTAGCPVILSDRTPWRDLPAKQVGWDLPLEDENTFIEVLNTVVDMDDSTFQLWSSCAHAYGLSIINDEAVVNANHLLFQQALSLHTHAMSKH